MLYTTWPPELVGREFARIKRRQASLLGEQAAHRRSKLPSQPQLQLQGPGQQPAYALQKQLLPPPPPQQQQQQQSKL